MNFREPCMCGAIDGVACRGAGAVAEFHPYEEWSDTGAHYVTTMTRSRVHVARIAHSGGRIQPGDTYRRSIVGGYISACEQYPEGGPRWLEVRKSLIKRAEAVA